MFNSLRASDNKSENAVAQYLDRYFYPGHVNNLKRFNDFETQMKGIDVQFDYSNRSQMLVDEKAAAHYVNKDIPTFAFEVNFLSAGGQLIDGWLFDENKQTQFYLLSWIKATKDKGFTVEDITELDILIVERSKLIQMLAGYGLSKEEARSKANHFRANEIGGVSDKSYDKPYYFYYTTHLAEKPVNVIIKKNTLIELSLGRYIIRPN